MLGGQAGKFKVGWIAYKFTRTSSKADAGAYKIYWPTGSRFSAHNGGSDLKFVDTMRVKTLLLLSWPVAKRDSAYS